MQTGKVRGSTLTATLVAVLLGWCALEVAASGDYGIKASFDSTSLELRLTLPVFCMQVSAVVVDRVTDLRLVSLCTRCGAHREPSWS